MNVTQVKDLFLAYIDESDETFLSAADRRRLLEQAYEEFRNIVLEFTDWYYITQVDVAAPSANNYDLAGNANPVRLMGNPAAGLTGPRLRRLVNIGKLDAIGGNVIDLLNGSMRLDAVAPLTSLGYQSWWNRSDIDFIMLGTVLQFNRVMSEPMRLYYVGAQAVTWSNDGAAATEYIDDLEQFHDVIALLAVRHYEVMDGQFNKRARALLEERLNVMRHFLSVGIDRDANSRVTAVV